ncbi:MAG: fibronectin/fibrinogen-binding protein [Clostridiales bacterium]|nr:fibronectin/fibrinogen-binding protein [Clostridiales bacterium]
MPFDGAFLHSVLTELNDTILGARIEKVLQPDRDEVILQLHTKSGSARLLLSANPSAPRLHLTDVARKNPDVPPTFCMLLRKHITSGRIIEVRQPDFDRIAEIVIQTKNDLQDITEKILIIEMMGKYSNIILTDSDYKIFDCIRRVDEQMSSVRELFPGIKYEKPPQSSKVDPRGFDENTPLYDGQVYADKFCGISFPTGQELAFYEKNSQTPISLLLERISSQKPVTYTNAKGKPDMLPYRYDTIESDFKEWESPSELLDSFFAIRDAKNRLSQYTTNVTKLLRNDLSRAEKKKALLEKELDDVKDNDLNRIYGDLLTANLYQLSKGMDKITVMNYYSDDCGDITIPLRSEMTPSENIKRYFKRYTKGKNALNQINKQLEETVFEIDYLSNQLYSIGACNTQEEIDEMIAELVKLGYMKPSSKQKKKNEKNPQQSSPFEYVTTAGRSVLVGRNSRQNEQLTHRMAKDDDVWLHAKNIAGSHVILRNGADLPEECIIEAARLAAFHSSASGATRVAVDYCHKKNVHKVNGAKPGYVIYDNYYTVVVDGTPESVANIKRADDAN